MHVTLVILPWEYTLTRPLKLVIQACYLRPQQGCYSNGRIMFRISIVYSYVGTLLIFKTFLAI